MTQAAKQQSKFNVSKTRESRPLPPIRTYVNASKRNEKPDKKDGITRSSIPKSLVARDEQVRQGKKMYEQERLDQCRQLEERSAPNLAYIEALDQKQSVLEVQAILLQKLAAEENQLKGLGEVPRTSNAPFETRISDVELLLVSRSDCYTPWKFQGLRSGHFEDS